MHHATVSPSTVVDPVCGMTIDPKHAAGSSQVAGTTYHFCAASCQAAFDASPTKYAAAAEPVASSGCSTSGHACCSA